MKGNGRGRIHSRTKGKGKGERKFQRQILDAMESGIIEAMQAITYEFKQQIDDMESKIIHKFTSAKESNTAEIDKHKVEISDV
eukprot:11101646-Karenia_brevis.AAC.1